MANVRKSTTGTTHRASKKATASRGSGAARGRASTGAMPAAGDGATAPNANAIRAVIGAINTNGIETPDGVANQPAAQSAAAISVPAPIAAGTVVDPALMAVPAVPDALALHALQDEVRNLQAQLAQAQATALAAAADDQAANGALVTIPKPFGSAGGGKRGFHLREEMGLGETAEGRKKYNMILATVRDLVHAARISLAHTYRQISAEDLAKVFQSARRIHPYLGRFENDWATAEVVKQYLASARRYGHRMGYFVPNAGANGAGVVPIDEA